MLFTSAFCFKREMRIKSLKDINWEFVKESLLDIFFPKFCFGCKREGFYVCDDCRVFLSENNLVCPVCGEASYCGKKHQGCGSRYDIDGLTSLWDYEGVIKKAIIDIKSNNHFFVGRKLIRRAFFEFIGEDDRFIDFLNFLFSDETRISYVPEYPDKSILKFEEDVNQAMKIAEGLAEVAGKEVVRTLEKTKKTEKQSELKKSERLKNVKGSFEAKDAKRYSKIVLVDDIFTTGATMRECGKVIKRSGVEEVWGFTLARTI